MSERAQLLLSLADDELILGWRDSEWTGIAPTLEEDVAFSSIAQNEIGHARALYELAAVELDTDADALAFDRAPDDYRCAPLVELRLLDDWALTIARRYLYEEADRVRIEALKESDDAELAGLAAKIDREEVYHRLHAELWAARLRDEPRFAAAVEELWPYALGVVEPDAARGARAPRRPAKCQVGTKFGARRAHARADGALGGDDRGAALGAGCAMVTAAEVWAALDEIPDPEIPVISLVDLGVIRDVQVDGAHVRIELTPTFLGCPALEAMRRALEEKVDVARRRTRGRGDPGRLVVDRPHHRRPAARSCARPASRRRRRARPARRRSSSCSRAPFAAPTAARPETRLENIFGPTPCRSIRWCESCRQPFEQFKTI